MLSFPIYPDPLRVLFPSDSPNKKTSQSTKHAPNYIVMYGCETWCFTLREENRVRLFEEGGSDRRMKKTEK
jgi:hypothetical protein